MRLGPALVLVAACSSVHDGQLEQGVQECPPTTVEGVDVYSGQGTIDWTKVKDSGRLFAFIKATQGNYNKQATFAANWANAKAAGLLRSPYHFFDGTIDGVAQAQWFLDEVNAAGGLQPGDLAPMLDIECPTSSVQAQAQSGCEYAGDSGWVATATLKQRIYAWIDTVQQATGRTPILYSYPSWFGDVMFTDAMLASYPLFIATYSSCASVPAPWTQAQFWQYSASATVPGITGQVDVDRFIGSAGDLAGIVQTAPPDAGVTPDADTMTAKQAAGCGCRTSSPGSLVLVAIAAPLVLRRRRAARRAAPAPRASTPRTRTDPCR
ncbi:MAG: glycoside hydrolase family 25 protein [Acidobacteriota bacterium]